MKRFDEKQFETSLIELAKPKYSKPLHELERSIIPTPLQISIKGDRNFNDTLPRARSPLQEELSSKNEDMEIPPSREDQDLGSLIVDEVFSNIDEEEEQKGSNNIITLGGEPSPHGDGHEVIASIIGAFASLQEVPKEHHVTVVMGSNTLNKGG